MEKQRAYSIVGNIAIVNFHGKVSLKEKREFAKGILEKNKSVRTVLEKSGQFKGRFRKQKTRFLIGENTREVLYKENGCEFRFNIDETYFSPRLSGNRKEVASLVKKGDEVFVGFSGVGPFSIVIGKNTKAKKVYSNELNRAANKYGKENIIRNKLSEKVEIVSGDFKKVCSKFGEEGKTFDFIMMARPNLKDTFLESALKISKKKTRIYYHGFCRVDKSEKLIEALVEEGKKFGRKLKVLDYKSIGEIAPYKIRLGVLMEIKN